MPMKPSCAHLVRSPRRESVRAVPGRGVGRELLLGEAPRHVADRRLALRSGSCRLRRRWRWLRRRRCTATPRRASARFACSAASRVTMMRAPEAPIGWPSAQAPPCTLTLSCGRPRSRMRRHRDDREGLVDLEQIDVVRRASRPCRAACGSPPTGAVGNHGRLLRMGRVADDLGERLQAALVRPPSARISTSAAAPSEIDEEFGGGDRAAVAEGRLQRRDLVRLRLERLLVLRDGHVALAALDRHRRDLGGEGAVLDRPSARASAKRARRRPASSRVN